VTDFEDQTIRAALDESIEANKQLLAEVDAALVASARAVADRIDDAVATADGQELTKALYLIPHVTNLLREMLATPSARLAAHVSTEVEGGKKAKLTALRSAKAAG
jgi:hypothetical protein